jgi:DNA invertase Pin-like site-specific DNA recombinase
MQAAIYCRVSSDPKGQGRSVAEQETECRAVAERAGWTVTQVFCDNDYSASRYAKRDRPAYERLMAYVAAGKADVLITWEASRFQRDLEDYVRLRELCRSHEVLWSYNARTYDLSRTDDRLMTGLDALLSEREADVTRERVLRAVRANAVAGRPHGRMNYGYKREYENGVLVRQVIDEDQAAVLREAAQRVLAGETPYAIAQDFAARAIPTPRGGKWELSCVKRLIVNPSIIGKRVHRGEIIGDAIWPAILDDDTFYRVKAKLEDPARRSNRDSAIRHLLSGIASCGVCGGHIRVGKPRGYLSYICDAKFCVARKTWAVDELITKLVIARLNRPDAADLFTTPENHDDLDELAALRARLDTFYDAAAAGEITATALARIETKLLAEITALEHRSRTANVPTVLYDMIGNAEAVWEQLSMPQRREVIKTLLDVKLLRSYRGARTLQPESVVVTWHSGSAAAVPSAQD